MHRCLRYFFFLLCVFLNVQVYGHAHSANANPSRHLRGKDGGAREIASDPDAYYPRPEVLGKDSRTRQSEVARAPDKRGFAWLFTVFQVVKIGGQVASTASSLLNIGNSIYRAIAGCCVEFPDACKSRDEFLQMKAKITEKSRRIDDLQLEAQNIQVWTNYTFNAFEDIVREINEITNEQVKYIQSYSNKVAMALRNATTRIKEMVKTNMTGNSETNVAFIDLTKLYESALDKTLSVTAPVIGLLLPFGGNIYNYAKRVIASRSAGAVEMALSAVLKTTASLKSKGTESRLSRFISESNRRLAIEAVKIKSHLNRRFGSAIKIASAIGKGLSVSMSYFNTGMNIYLIISSREVCKKRQEQAQQASKELNQAMKNLNDAEANILKAKEVMQKSFEYLHANITNKDMKTFLANVKNMIEEISSPSKDLEEVAIGIDHFLNNIDSETTPQGTYRLQQTLLKALAQIPLTLRCYGNKVKMTNHVFASCGKGRASFDEIYDEARGLFDMDAGLQRDSHQNCERKIGFRYINKDDMKAYWPRVADKEGVMENCVLNDPNKKEFACAQLRHGYSNTQIANKLSLSEEDVLYLTKHCPTAKELTPVQKQSICKFKKFLTDEQIAEALMIDLNLIKNVNCSR